MSSMTTVEGLGQKFECFLTAQKSFIGTYFMFLKNSGTKKEQFYIQGW